MSRVPLNALVDGEPVFGFTVDEGLWSALRRGVRDDRKIAYLECGQRAYPFYGPTGRRFFRHGQSSGCSDVRCASGISEEHLEAQYDILSALCSLGYKAYGRYEGSGWGADYLALKGCTPEELDASRSGWRADVLAAAKPPFTMHAFEVQTSPQTIEATEDRFAKYYADAVPCLWLFKRRPHGWTKSKASIVRMGRTERGSWVSTGPPIGAYDLGAFIGLWARDTIAWRSGCGNGFHPGLNHWCDPRPPEEAWKGPSVDGILGPDGLRGLDQMILWSLWFAPKRRSLDNVVFCLKMWDVPFPPVTADVVQTRLVTLCEAGEVVAVSVGEEGSHEIVYSLQNETVLAARNNLGNTEDIARLLVERARGCRT